MALAGGGLGDSPLSLQGAPRSHPGAVTVSLSPGDSGPKSSKELGSNPDLELLLLRSSQPVGDDNEEDEEDFVPQG